MSIEEPTDKERMETLEYNLVMVLKDIKKLWQEIGEWSEHITETTYKHMIEAHKFKHLNSAKRIRESIEDIDRKYDGLFHDIQEHFQLSHPKKKDTSKEGTDYL